ncbi:MAG: MoaD/ThiS family protein [Ardenticatenaceae bacterium]|nr:MoaD/ThiS family protein [Ardenticatenaceae bacterium]HBY98462.1 hypothetical protein [Chloroflexota bacterium]
MIEVRVKLYAGLRRYRPGLAIGQSFICSVPGDSTVGHLLDELGIPSLIVAIILVNGIQSEREHRLTDGDEVALWPPVAGGSSCR